MQIKGELISQNYLSFIFLGSERRNPPEQLPIVLQVLLSNVHRMRALELLGRFLDLGPWAVNLALSVGIFPYVLKLLQSFAKELRPLLVFIWAKILAVDDVSLKIENKNNIFNLYLYFRHVKLNLLEIMVINILCLYFKIHLYR